jgi:hypothetical protein
LACDLSGLAVTVTLEPFTYRYMAQDASDAVVGLVARSAIPPHLWGTAEGDTAAEAAFAEQIPKHCQFLRDIFGNPCRQVTFDPAWRTPAVVALARTMYDERQFGEMPFLGDALEEAGCISDQILSHCRGPGPHVRGCWVIDLILGKE